VCLLVKKDLDGIKMHGATIKKFKKLNKFISNFAIIH